jgi:hypothetical protein
MLADVGNVSGRGRDRLIAWVETVACWFVLLGLVWPAGRRSGAG